MPTLVAPYLAMPVHGAEAPVHARREKRQLSYIQQAYQWIKLKIYRYEVTFSLYMMTSTEKFVFNVILLTLISLLLTATVVYLPDHLRIIYNRVVYYVFGELRNIKNGQAGLTRYLANSNTVGTATQEFVASTTTRAAAAAMTAVERMGEGSREL